MLASVAVTTQDKTLELKARALAESLALPFASNADYLLRLSSEKLELVKPDSQTTPLFVDFSSFVFRQGKEPIVKAVGAKGNYKPFVLDVTAGLGQDAFVLAASGCRVSMCERSKVVAALLQDGITRASESSTLNEIVARMTLVQADALSYLQDLRIQPDVIYLDPMYPESGKRAAKRKSMTFFRDILGDDLDAHKLLDAALGKASKRVVVKRPFKAGFLNEQKPSAQMLGKTTRFDIYIPIH